MSSEAVERLTLSIARMGRRALVQTLRELECSFELDFTDEYLESISLERLQHLVLVAVLHNSQVEQASTTHAT